VKRPQRKPFAKKSLGQNFLSDPNYIQKIIASVDPRVSDTIVEIGPGRGALTEELVASQAGVIAIELDRDLSALLSERFAKHDNFRLIEGDILEIDLRALPVDQSGHHHRPSDSMKLVANLPYYISTAVLQKLAANRQCFGSVVLMFQREVVRRITAAPGNSERGYLTVIAESAFQIETLFDVPPSAFRPIPKVWSSVVRLTPKPPSATDHESFSALVSRSFAHKRKTLANNLRGFYPKSDEALGRACIDPQRRAESLNLEEWLTLLRAIDHS
jgi:16S rRNA (adenine1518-N6/adenine1519-N6)-dimethyltransferase